MICGLPIVSRNDPDFEPLKNTQQEAMARNGAVLTRIWPKNLVHKRCCIARTALMPEPSGALEFAGEDLLSKELRSTTPPPSGDSRSALPGEVEVSLTNGWGSIMNRMQPAPAKKPKPAPKPKSASKPKPAASMPPERHQKYPQRFTRACEGEFDVAAHGYWLVRGELRFRAPGDRTLACTGVDNFGPFRLAQ